MSEVQGMAGPRELLCMLCGRDYPIWSADNDLWNAVMREDGTDEYPFVCPTCFTVRAVFLGVTTAFYLTDAHGGDER